MCQFQGSLTHAHEVAHAVEESCAYIAIPIVVLECFGLRTGAYLGEIEGDDLAAGCGQGCEQVVDLLVFKATRHGRTCIGAELGIQSVDIEGYVDLLWKPGDDLFADAAPMLPTVAARGQIGIEVGLDAALGVLYESGLAFAKIADAHLYQFTHLR